MSKKSRSLTVNVAEQPETKMYFKNLEAFPEYLINWADCSQIQFPLRTICQNQQLISFITHSELIHMDSLREFYSNLTLDKEGRLQTTVSCQSFLLTSSLIARALRYSDSKWITATRLDDAYLRNATPENKEEIRGILKMKAPEKKAANLCDEARILLHFVHKVLLPKKGGTDQLSDKEMFLLSCLITGEMVHLPILILERLSIYIQRKGPMPYAKLVIRLLKNLNIIGENLGKETPQNEFSPLVLWKNMQKGKQRQMQRILWSTEASTSEEAEAIDEPAQRQSRKRPAKSSHQQKAKVPKLTDDGKTIRQLIDEKYSDSEDIEAAVQTLSSEDEEQGQEADSQGELAPDADAEDEEQGQEADSQGELAPEADAEEEEVQTAVPEEAVLLLEGPPAETPLHIQPLQQMRQPEALEESLEQEKDSEEEAMLVEMKRLKKALRAKKAALKERRKQKEEERKRKEEEERKRREEEERRRKEEEERRRKEEEERKRKEEEERKRREEEEAKRQKEEEEERRRQEEEDRLRKEEEEEKRRKEEEDRLRKEKEEEEQRQKATNEQSTVENAPEASEASAPESAPVLSSELASLLDQQPSLQLVQFEADVVPHPDTLKGKDIEGEGLTAGTPQRHELAPSLTLKDAVDFAGPSSGRAPESVFVENPNFIKFGGMLDSNEKAAGVVATTVQRNIQRLLDEYHKWQTTTYKQQLEDIQAQTTFYQKNVEILATQELAQRDKVLVSMSEALEKLRLSLDLIPLKIEEGLLRVQNEVLKLGASGGKDVHVTMGVQPKQYQDLVNSCGNYMTSKVIRKLDTAVEVMLQHTESLKPSVEAMIKTTVEASLAKLQQESSAPQTPSAAAINNAIKLLDGQYFVIKRDLSEGPTLTQTEQTNLVTLILDKSTIKPAPDATAAPADPAPAPSKSKPPKKKTKKI